MSSVELNYLPMVAAKVSERYASRPFWQISAPELLCEIANAGEAVGNGVGLTGVPAGGLPEVVGAYLSALLTPNTPENLVEYGRRIIGRYEGEITTLVQLTNGVFKSLSLTPPIVEIRDNFRHDCIAVNFQTQVLANLRIHAAQSADDRYYAFSREIDARLTEVADLIPNERFCFVFLTEDYIENFYLWVDVFAASTALRERLLIACLGERVGELVGAKLRSMGFANATVIDLIFSREKFRGSGNGEHLYYLWYLKIHIARHLIERNCDFIYSDLDSFWFKNFFVAWDTDPTLSDIDVAFMPSRDMPPYAVQRWGVIPCCGFFACRASDRVRSFFRSWEYWVEVMFDDQIGLAQLLMDAGVIWEKHDDVAGWRNAVWGPRPPAARRLRPDVRLCILNPEMAVRVGAPDISTATGVTIWHPRWITSKGQHAEIAPRLVALAAGTQEGELTARETLTELANRYGSDKGTTKNPAHHYTFLYDLLFVDARDAIIDFLEIGLAVGGPELGKPAERLAVSPSVQMWLTYFSQANIFGFDISDFSHMKGPRFNFTRGDCGNTDDLKSILLMCPEYDVIIDDASHALYHQQNTFAQLFFALRPGGLYIIEDLHWQSPFFEKELPVVPKTWDFFEAYFNKGDYIKNDLLTERLMSAVKRETYYVSFFRDFSGQSNLPKIMVLKKKGIPRWM